jgi:hypothetical protein
MEIETTRQFCGGDASLPWTGVYLPHGWHLNQAPVPMPDIPARRHAHRQEILQRRANLPPDLWRDPAYAVDLPL